MDVITLKLRTPIQADGITIDTLTLRELKVKELLALEEAAAAGNRSAGKQEVHRFALMTGLSPDSISELSERDWNRLRTKYWETVGNVLDDQEEATSD